MTTDSSTNNGHIAFSNDVGGDVEEASPVGKDLSQSDKAWDIDGDGKLDPTELALKDIDKTGKGTLSKDQMYHLMNQNHDLMHQNLSVRKELTKVKKFVIGLVVITALLALANVGVSFAAAYLAKDTKTVEGKLVVSSSGETVKTDSTTKLFMVDTELEERVRRERRLQCSILEDGIVLYANCDVGRAAWAYVPWGTGRDIIGVCFYGGSVTIVKDYTDANDAVVTKTHQICPATDATYANGANGGMTITKTNAPDITVQPVSGENYYAIDGLGEVGDSCTETSHGIDNDCGADMKCEKANPGDEYGECVPSIGHAAVISCNCGSNLVCNGGICKGLLGHDCNDFENAIENHCDTNLKCETVDPTTDPYGVCMRSIGATCDDATNPCGSNLVCDGGICKGLLGHDCDDFENAIENHCAANLKCEENVDSNFVDVVTGITGIRYYGVCVLSIGAFCDDATNPCGSDLICDGGICQGALGHDCDDFDHDIENHCDTNLKCEKADRADMYGTCVPSIGHGCKDAKDCGSNLSCTDVKCRGHAGHGCKNPKSGPFNGEDDLCINGSTCTSTRASAAYHLLGYGECDELL